MKPTDAQLLAQARQKIKRQKIAYRQLQAAHSEAKVLAAKRHLDRCFDHDTIRELRRELEEQERDHA